MNIRPVGAELFHADGRTGGRADEKTDGLLNITKLIATFRNFANATKNEWSRTFDFRDRIAFYVGVN